MTQAINFGDWIVLDTQYVEPEFCSQYIRVIQGKVFVVETNTSFAANHLLAKLKEWGLKPTDVEVIVVTHIHLDHASGAGTLLKACPNAALYAHPRAARHAIDPSKLIASARTVYGDKFDTLYGEILPCPADRVVELEDGQAFDWRGITFFAKHTRGHANHHLCLVDETSRTLFSGDSFGVSYPFATTGARFVLPSTSPTDFDAEAAMDTVNWIRSLKIDRVGLTHYGFITTILEFSEQMIFQIQQSKNTMEWIMEELRSGRGSGDSTAEFQNDVTARLEKNITDAVQKFGLELSNEGRRAYQFDLKINAQGLIFAAGKAIKPQ